MPDLVYARGVHLAALTLLCDVLTALHLGSPAALAPERTLIAERARARVDHLRRHLRVAPIVEPAWRRFASRWARSLGRDGPARAHLRAAREAAERLGMPLVVARVDAEPLLGGEPGTPDR
jgi:hypothetical protein